MPASKGASWKPREDELLRNHWAGSASKMMALLPGRTRNAIIGRAHRLKIKIPLPTILPPSLRWLPRKERPLPVKRVRPRAKAPAPPKQIPADIWAPLPGTTPVSMVDVETDHCRWPIGNQFCGFCGCQKAPNSAYCATHSQIAFVKTTRQW
jgi:GcrA cell cycle regulator